MKYYTSAEKQLLGALVGLARSLDETNSSAEMLQVFVEALQNMQNNTECAIAQVAQAKKKAVPDCSICKNPCGRTDNYNLEQLNTLPPQLSNLKFALLEEICNYGKRVTWKEQHYLPTLRIFAETFFAIGYDYLSETDAEALLTRLKTL